ncbi:MAG: hypothetical protein ACHQUC_10115 [Chlamydiales bacterium]
MSMSTRCISSQLLSHVLEWRNPQGAEEGWLNGPQGIDNIWQFRKKVAVAEVGIIALSALALVEIVAYAALAIVSLALSPFTKRPYQFFASLLQSSSFTILWGLADALIYNPFFVNVMTREPFARVWANIINPTSIRLLRPSDMAEIARWELQHMPRVIIISNVVGLLRPIAEVGRNVNEGAAFIKEDVLTKEVPSEKIESIKDMDPGILHFFLIKAIASYRFGTKSEAPIPSFFKRETRASIEQLRREGFGLSDKLMEAINHLEEYAEELENKALSESFKTTYARLREVAAGELQGGIFVTGCLQKALDDMR